MITIAQYHGWTGRQLGKAILRSAVCIAHRGTVQN